MKIREFTVGKTIFIEDHANMKVPVAELMTTEKTPRAIGWLYPDGWDQFTVNETPDFVRDKQYLGHSPKLSFKGILDGKVDVPAGDDSTWDEQTWEAYQQGRHAIDIHDWTVVSALKGAATLACLDLQNWWKSKNAMYKFAGLEDITKIMYVEQELPVDKAAPRNGQLSDGRYTKDWYPSNMDIFILEVLKYLGYSGYEKLTIESEGVNLP